MSDATADTEERSRCRVSYCPAWAGRHSLGYCRRHWYRLSLWRRGGQDT